MGNTTIQSKIIFSNYIEETLLPFVSKYPRGKVFLATEETVSKLWLPELKEFLNANQIKTVCIPAGEQAKKIESVTHIWEFLSNNGADRKSLLINIGGGMLTDLAGFAASTFKRGIDFLNIPTTLLSQVDASVGGKTGINFNGLKNEIGTFNEPIAVIINTLFLKTIDRENFLSGFAEMIKHGFIHSEAHLKELQEFNLDNIDYLQLQTIIEHSVEVKKYFVANDPTEKNIRKALNFGHTVSHAFESLAMEKNRPILHGFGVACGMVAELYLSAKVCKLPMNELETLSQWIVNLYGKFEITPSDYQRLYSLMTHDKKNEAGRINFTLIPRVGEIAINQNCNQQQIFEALDYYRNL